METEAGGGWQRGAALQLASVLRQVTEGGVGPLPQGRKGRGLHLKLLPSVQHFVSHSLSPTCLWSQTAERVADGPPACAVTGAGSLAHGEV